MVPKLESQTLESLSDLSVTFSLGNHPCESYPRTVLVMGCSGAYGVGSAGNPDATFLMAMGKAGIEAFGPHGMILDLSELTYEWGDMLEAVFGIAGDKPMAVVVGEQCRVAIGTLCFGETSTTDACEEQWIFDSLSDAWNYVANLLDEGETPPLHAAARAGDAKRLAELLSEGADPNREDSQGNRPLHEASDVQTAGILIDAGADVRAKNRSGVTALHLASDIELARLFIAAGADPDARSHYGGSPLGGTTSPEIAQLLIDAGADVQLRARSTLIHHVRNPEVARVFLDAGVDVNAIDENGKTPLDMALQNQKLFEEQARRTWGSKTDRHTSRHYEKIADMIRKRGGMTADELEARRQ